MFVFPDSELLNFNQRKKIWQWGITNEFGKNDTDFLKATKEPLNVYLTLMLNIYFNNVTGNLT